MKETLYYFGFIFVYFIFAVAIGMAIHVTFGYNVMNLVVGCIGVLFWLVALPVYINYRVKEGK